MFATLEQRANIFLLYGNVKYMPMLSKSDANSRIEYSIEVSEINRVLVL